MIPRERIIDTREGGAVAVTCPSEWAILALMQGGAWVDQPWWFWIVQFNRMLARGVKPRAAYRYARTMMTGGATRREAIEIIAARDCAHLGTAIEIVDVDEIPTDRTYRNAWRRSQNGGPIYIDDDHAMIIDEQRAWSDYERT